jgi:putative flippase GtrA|tara:strand:- start:280 stop:705 length:426 start_codon:yes stop_codon:yes gene_type:complete
MHLSKLRNLLSNQKARYLITGGYNTVFGYLLFILIFYYFSSTVSHYFLLGICHLLGTIHNFFSYSTFVFKPKTNAFKNYFKFNLVYLFIFLLNLVMFTLLTKVMNWNLYFSQALIVALIAVVGYILNKNYSFSNKLIFKKK